MEPARLKRAKLGVIIGRFQVEDVSKGHRDLIEQVRKLHNKVLILVGCSPIPGTANNPLDYPTREKMLRGAFPEITCLPIMDQPNDIIWSRLVDSTVRSVFPIGKACVYGGRDSFIPYYHGDMDAVEFPAVNYRPGIEIREEIGNVVPTSPAGRAGVIYASQNRFPTGNQCVDIVVFKSNPLRIIAGQRSSEMGAWRLPGGFRNPKESLEATCRREVREEVGCEICDPWYITSMDTEDWRYNQSSDGLVTALFGARYQSGPTIGGDDLPNTFWVDPEERFSKFIPGHQKLVQAFLDHGRRE